MNEQTGKLAGIRNVLGHLTPPQLEHWVSLCLGPCVQMYVDYLLPDAASKLQEGLSLMQSVEREDVGSIPAMLASLLERQDKWSNFDSSMGAELRDVFSQLSEIGNVIALRGTQGRDEDPVLLYQELPSLLFNVLAKCIPGNDPVDIMRFSLTRL